jgi:hypothetical protein
MDDSFDHVIMHRKCGRRIETHQSIGAICWWRTPATGRRPESRGWVRHCRHSSHRTTSRIRGIAEANGQKADIQSRRSPARSGWRSWAWVAPRRPRLRHAGRARARHYEIGVDAAREAPSRHAPTSRVRNRHREATDPDLRRGTPHVQALSAAALDPGLREQERGCLKITKRFRNGRVAMLIQPRHTDFPE